MLKLHLFDLLWIYCTTSCTTNPQHLDMSRCCRFVVNFTTNPQQIDSCTTNPQHMSRCCRFLVDSISNPQQIHSKSKQCSLGFDFPLISCNVAADANKIQLQANAADDITLGSFAHDATKSGSNKEN